MRLKNLMPMRLRVMTLCLAAAPVARAQAPAITVQIYVQTSGQVRLEAWPLPHEQPLAAVASGVVPCRGRMKFDAGTFGQYHCSNALRREGLTLATDFDLTPIARQLQPWEEMNLFLDAPRLGFLSSSVALADEGRPLRAMGTAHFPAAAAPHLHVQFGYRRDQLAAIYLPFVPMGLALFLLALALSRGGLASLNLSVFLLGSILWMGVAARLQAGAPLEILLFDTPFAHAVALLLTFAPPLFCVAAGVALGSKPQSRSRGRMFSEIFWGYGVFLLPVACAAGALPSMMDNDWLAATPWLIALPAFVLFGRIAIRARAGSSLRQIQGGELFDRVSQLAVRAGWRRLRIYVSVSAYMNAFTLPGRSIFFTAPLLRLLPRREVDAVAAHELSHIRHASNRPWLALALAMILFETAAGDLVLGSTVGFTIAMLLPVTIYLIALHGVRKREFQADAGAVRLGGDPRALIGALERISRTNDRPLGMNPIAEWFSSHPSTLKRIRAMAAAGGIPQAEFETLLADGVPGEPYPLPTQEGGAIFTAAWQKINAGVYGWTVLFAACDSGLAVTWVLYRFAASGIAALAGGIVLGCALTKVAGSAVMARSYARLGRRLAARLGVSGEIMGLAIGSEPRVYNGFRFSDAGLLWFEEGQLRYRSERTAIDLNPADVVETGSVAAAPSSWFRLQPMLRFRAPTGETLSFILHPLDLLPAQRRLLGRIQRWQATAVSSTPTSIRGFDVIPGEAFAPPSIAVVVRAFVIPGGLTLVGAIAARLLFHVEWRYAIDALAITACAHLFMFLPSTLYRPSPPAALNPSEDAS